MLNTNIRPGTANYYPVWAVPVWAVPVWAVSVWAVPVWAVSVWAGTSPSALVLGLGW
jgi:hypothetical protein